MMCMPVEPGLAAMLAILAPGDSGCDTPRTKLLVRLHATAAVALLLSRSTACKLQSVIRRRSVCCQRECR